MIDGVRPLATRSRAPSTADEICRLTGLAAARNVDGRNGEQREITIAYYATYARGKAVFSDSVLMKNYLPAGTSRRSGTNTMTPRRRNPASSRTHQKLSLIVKPKVQWKQYAAEPVISQSTYALCPCRKGRREQHHRGPRGVLCRKNRECHAFYENADMHR